MLLKLCALIVAVAGCSTALLTVRQQRLEAAHEMARSVQRAQDLEEQLWRIRAVVAERVTPSRVRVMAASLGGLVPIVPHWCEPDEMLDADAMARERALEEIRLAGLPADGSASGDGAGL